jgi:hypothetical protein
MFGRIFGRGKDDPDQAVCAECGRTLLAGEWTQTVRDEHGEERLICSLCGQAYAGADEAVAAAPAPANNGRMRETRSESRPPDRAAAPDKRAERHNAYAESDAFWQELRRKDDHIERLKAELARIEAEVAHAEAERAEFAARFARPSAAAEADEPGSLTGDSSEPGERTWGETPAEFAAEIAALREAEAALAEPPAAMTEAAADAEAPRPRRTASAAAPTDVEPFDNEAAETDDGLDALSDETTADAQAPEEPYAPDADLPAADADHGAVHTAPSDDPEPAAPLDEMDDAAAASTEPAEQTDHGINAGWDDDVTTGVADDTQPIATITDDMLSDDDELTGEISAAGAASSAEHLTLLQRGIDLLNVSPVPRKIAETNEQLGLPHVHAGCDGHVVSITFMWTMGWYRFAVNLDDSHVVMSDRGYDDPALAPNAGVRADGTVQLAPAQISRAAAHRAGAATETPARPNGGASRGGPAEPATPHEAAQKPPEFLSKSLLGQRSDDESASWEQTKARDFDWER